MFTFIIIFSVLLITFIILSRVIDNLKRNKSISQIRLIDNTAYLVQEPFLHIISV